MKFLRLEDIQAEYQNLATCKAELSEHLQEGKNPIAPAQNALDYASALENGWEWLFSHIAENQPKTFASLAIWNPRLVVGERLWQDRLDSKRMHWSTNGFVAIQDDFFVFHPEFKGFRIEQIGSRHPAYERYKALPEKIAKAYYARADGYEIVNSLPTNSFDKRVLPAPISCWKRAMTVCEKTKKSQSALRASLGKVSDSVSLAKGPVEDTFWVFLDSRPQDDYESAGDYLFVQEGSSRPQIFHMKDRDYGNLRVVESPTEFLDDYVSNLLKKNGEPFDFSSYSKPVA